MQARARLISLLTSVALAGAAMRWSTEPAAAAAVTVPSTHSHVAYAPLVTGSELSVDGTWLPIAPPGGRREHAAVYDSQRGRMIVFGGYQERNSGWTDTWELDLDATPVWRKLETAGTPPAAITGRPAIYDPVRDRMIAYRWDTLWELSLSGTPTWSILSTSGAAPPPRLGHSMIYDPVEDRVVVFGGYGTTYLNDVWALSLSGVPSWSQLSTTGGPPAPRWEHVAVYDATRHELVIHGGEGSAMLGDAWTLSLDAVPTWTVLAPVGTPPANRKRHAGIYDPAGDRVVVFGGQYCDFCAYSNETWELSLTGSPTWSPVTPAGTPPTARAGHTAIRDPVGGRMLVFGGTDVEDDLWHISHLNDTWALSLDGPPAWSEPAGSAPPGLGLHSAIYRSAGHQAIVFGGYDGLHLHNDVWVYSPLAVPSWSRLAPSGTPPGKRRGHSAIYDPPRDRMVLFGGAYGGGNDVWELTFSGTPTWTQIVPLGSPPSARSQHTAIYDPVRDRMLVFGGVGGATYWNDLWELTLSGTPTWTQLAAAGTLPAGRSEHSAIYDPVGDRMLVFGGNSSSGLRGDVHSLSLAGTPTWSALAPSGSPPPSTSEHSAIHDPVRGRMVTFGGRTTTGNSNTAWGLSLGGTPTWTQLLPSGALPRTRRGAAAIYDPVGDRMVVHAGWLPTAFEYIFIFSDVWMLSWSDLVGVPVPGFPSGLELVASFPNPAVAGVTIRLALPAPGHASLVIYDLAGRRVTTLLDAHETAGPHEIRWDLRTERGARARAGVYWYELRTAGVRAARRLVVLD